MFGMAFSQALSMMLMVLTGYFCVRLGVIQTTYKKELSGLVFNVLLPCTVFDSMLMAFSPQQLKDALSMLGLGVLISVYSLLIGYLCYALLGRKEEDRILCICFLLSNTTYFGFPIIRVLYGETGLFLFSMFTTPTRILHLTLSALMYGSRAGGARRINWRSIFSPVLISLVSGFLCFMLQIRVPLFLEDTIAAFGAASSPLGMLLCGISLAQTDFSRMGHKLRIITISFIKLGLAPGLVFLLARLLGLDGMTAVIPIMFCALPFASILNTYAVQYGFDPEFVTIEVSITTILAVLSAPLWASWANVVFL